MKTNRLLALVALLTCLVLAGLASCDGSGNGEQSAASTTSVMPTPNGTEADLATDEASYATFTPTQPVPTEIVPLASHPSLVKASPQEIAQLALQRVHTQAGSKVKPEVLLARRTTELEMYSLGGGCPGNIDVVDPAPLMLVLLHGDFELGGLGPDMGGPASYVLMVYDLWAGYPTYIAAGMAGDSFSKLLTEAGINATPSVNQPTIPAYVCPTPDPAAKPPLGWYYGDTAPPISMAGDQVRHTGFVGWEYYAVRNVPASIRTAEDEPLAPGQIYATVNYDAQTKETLQRYIDTNKEMVAQMAGRRGQVETWIIFNDYVSVVQFRTFAQAHHLKTGVTYLRAIDEDPLPAYPPIYKLHVVRHADSADPIPQNDLDNLISGMKKYVPQLDLKGVYATHTWLDASELPALAADPSVFYVDLTATATRDDLVQAGIPGAAQAVVDVPAWHLFTLVEKPYVSK